MKPSQLGKRVVIQKHLLHDYLKGKKTYVVKVPARGAGAGEGTGVRVRAGAGAGAGARVKAKGRKGGQQP